mgnify:CR=1 FL=1
MSIARPLPTPMLLLGALLLAACGGDGSDSAGEAGTTEPTSDSTPDTLPDTDTGTEAPTDSATDTGTLDTGTIDTGTTPTGPTLDPDVATYVPAGWPPPQPARVIFLGDSITDGVGVANQDLAYPSLLVSNDDATWPDHLDGDLSSRWPGIEVIDVARSGATTETVLAGQLPAIEAALGGPPVGPTLVVGTVGGNDVSGTIFGFGNLEEEAPKIVDRVDDIAAWFADPARFPDGAYVYLTNVYEPTDAEGQADECFFGLNLSNIQPTFEAINADMRVRAEQNSWAMVDLRGHFKGHGFNHDDPKIAAYHADDPTLWLSRDCIHPNQRGHHEVRRLFLAAIDALPLRSTP